METTIEPINRVIFEIGPFTVSWYGFIIASGIVLALFLAIYEGKKRGIAPDTFTDVLVIAIPAAIIGARLWYVIFKWSDYSDDPVRIFKIWEGGLAIHGALVGSVLAAYFFTKARKISFWKLVDIAAPSILLGQAMGRWGNFFNQEAFGGEVSRKFLENLQLPDFIINQMYVNGAYHHPTFLYESIWNIIGIVVIILFRKTNPRLGEAFFAYLIWYSVGRFFIEALRTDSLMIGGLRTAQVTSIGLIVLCVAGIIIRRKLKLSETRYLES